MKFWKFFHFRTHILKRKTRIRNGENIAWSLDEDLKNQRLIWNLYVLALKKQKKSPNPNPELAMKVSKQKIPKKNGFKVEP